MSVSSSQQQPLPGMQHVAGGLLQKLVELVDLTEAPTILVLVVNEQGKMVDVRVESMAYVAMLLKQNQGDL